jgi:alanine dehydrogenase
MNIGIPKETWSGETRAAATRGAVMKLRAKGREILIENSAGIDSLR